MIHVVPFDVSHIFSMAVQPAQRRSEFEHPEALSCPFGQGWTAMVDGRPIACAGLVQTAPDEAYAWALLADDAGPWLLHITREIRCRLASAQFRRIEMAVDASFEAGLRWAPMLGFVFERICTLQNGHSAHFFARESYGPSLHDDGCQHSSECRRRNSQGTIGRC